MADENTDAKDVFRRSALNRVASSDELDHYIKVTNPSAWVVTLAALLLIVGILAWATLATVPVTIETTGITTQDPDSGKMVVLSWVDKTAADRIKATGMKASVDGVEAKDAKLSYTPRSRLEVTQFLGLDYYSESLKLEDWNYLVIIEPAEDPNHTDFAIDTAIGEAHIVPVSIVMYETRPINIVLGKK